MSAVFNRPLTPAIMHAYADALAEVPIEALEGAARGLIANSQWFPKPVEWEQAAITWGRQREREARERRLKLPEEAASQAMDPEAQRRHVRALLDELDKKLGPPTRRRSG